MVKVLPVLTLFFSLMLTNDINIYETVFAQSTYLMAHSGVSKNCNTTEFIFQITAINISYFGNSILRQDRKHFHIFSIILSSKFIHLPQPKNVYMYVRNIRMIYPLKLSISLYILTILLSIKILSEWVSVLDDFK